AGRMFWPAFYAFLWLLVRTVFKRYPPKIAALVLFIAVVAQTVDTSAGWLPIRRSMEPVGATWPSPLKSPFWAQVPTNYRQIRLVTTRNRAPGWDTFAYFCATHGMASDAWYGARIDETKLREAKREALAAVNKGTYIDGVLYILEPRYERAAARSLHPETDWLGQVDGFLVLAPGWRCRAECTAANSAEKADCSSTCPKR
ncbi:MAG: hypothetical protein ABIQ16_11880, partial [Polyangiaceae bacterium]